MSKARPHTADVGSGIKFAGIAVRSIFMILLIILVARLSAPQNETIWTVYDTPGDLVRLVLGAAVCLWIVPHIFMLPKDAQAYKTWIFLSVPLLPLGFLLAFAIW